MATETFIVPLLLAANGRFAAPHSNRNTVTERAGIDSQTARRLASKEAPRHASVTGSVAIMIAIVSLILIFPRLPS
jgi:hypothetical protein